MSTHGAGVVSRVPAVFRREPGLTGLGLAGLVIAALCLAAVGARGSSILPEGKMLDAATFSFGVGVFALTLALLLPLTGWSQGGRRRWRRWSYVFLAYGLVLEPLQSFRGLDPRFTRVGGLVDVIAGITFGVTAAIFTVLLVVLGVRFFQPGVLDDRVALRTGIRYGMVGVWLSFAVGLVMSVLQGRGLGPAGDLMLTHALGVHAIQAMPALAALLASAGAGPRPRAWVHAAGAGWLAAMAATLVQAVSGRPPFEPSLLLAVAGVGLSVWAVAGGHAVRCASRGPALGSS